jgi:bile acid-coenzyme A ligase
VVDRADALAYELLEHGVGIGDLVSIGLPSNATFMIAMLATWIVGATPQPVPSNMPRHELDAVLDLAKPKIAIGFDGGDYAPTLLELPEPSGETREPLPDVMSPNF